MIKVNTVGLSSIVQWGSKQNTTLTFSILKTTHIVLEMPFSLSVTTNQIDGVVTPVHTK